MRIFFIIWICIITISLNGQKNDSLSNDIKTKKFDNHFLGINAGITTGLGFSYRYWPGRSGFQITFLPLYDKEKTYVSFSTTYLFEIKQYKSSRFIFYSSNHITNILVSHNRYVDNLGVGIGVDYLYSDFVINFMVGYTGIDLFDDFKTRPSVESGIFYNF
jgi:hypothetical protein